MSDLLQDVTPLAVALSRGDLVYMVIDPLGTPLDRGAAIEFLLANLPKLDNIALQSEVDSVTFFQILDTDGGVPVLNVDTVNERVGIGDAAPANTLQVKQLSAGIIANFSAGGGQLHIADRPSTGGIGRGIHGGLSSEVGLHNIGADITFFTENPLTEKVTFKFGGDVGIGSTIGPTAGGGKVLFFGDNAADPTMASNTAGFYGKDVAGTVEAFAIDEAGNAAQLTSHPEDAPPTFYLSVSEDEIPSFIRKSFNVYIGKIEWFRSDIPLRSYETFDDYNTRHGFVMGDSGFLIQYDWTEQQQIQVDRSEQEHAAWEQRRDAAAAAGEPFNEPEPAIYTAKEPPQSLQDRGITLKAGS